MMNMSYCRFENTYHALVEYEGALEEIESLSNLSGRERDYAERLADLCEEVVVRTRELLEEEDF